MTPINPVVSGLVNAFNLANMMHNQRRQDEAIALDRRRQEDAEAARQSREEFQQAELSTRLHAIGARSMTPSDELELQTGTRIDLDNRLQQRGGVGPDGLPQTEHSLEPRLRTGPSDLQGRIVKVRGQSYVLPSQAEVEARADQANERATARDVAKATAVGKARSDAEIAGKKAEVDQLGITLTDEQASVLNLPKGQKVLPEHLDDTLRAYATAKTAELKQHDDVADAVPMYGERGTGIAVITKGGKVTWNPIDIGDKFTKPTTISPNQQRLLEKEALKVLVDETAGNYVSQHANADQAETALKAASATDPFVKKNYLSILAGIRRAAPKTAPGATRGALPGRAGGRGNPAAAAPSRIEAVNPQTGEKVVWDGKAWTPVR